VCVCVCVRACVRACMCMCVVMSVCLRDVCVGLSVCLRDPVDRRLRSQEEVGWISRLSSFVSGQNPKSLGSFRPRFRV
jgi:hypothetical protein